MEKKINIAELLKGCPKGMELDCTIFDTKVIYQGLNKKIPTHPIVVQTEHEFEFELTQYGQTHNIVGSKCVIFPKGKTTWEGFQRPFKDGDILTYTSNYTSIFIYRNKENEPNYSTSFYVGCNDAPTNNFLIYNKYTLIALNGNCDVRLATEEEKQKLFDAIKANGYKWNDKTKTLEKLVKPKFKVGDRIRNKHINSGTDVIIDIEDNWYVLSYCDQTYLNFKCQDNYELVPNKFDITTLKPFESKVLVRNSDNHNWCPAIFGCKLSSHTLYKYVTMTERYYAQCIPYEGNEHLSGTTDDCDEYYKSW